MGGGGTPPVFRHDANLADMVIVVKMIVSLLQLALVLGLLSVAHRVSLGVDPAVLLANPELLWATPEKLAPFIR